MTTQLGSMPPSSDILAEAKIGLWALEIDEGKPPRMYMDAALQNRVGLSDRETPEEIYREWFDHIDEGHRGMILNLIKRMTAGEYCGAQYPWQHPDGTTIAVRCAGVRNYRYTQGVRLEGTHQNVSEVIRFAEEKLAEQDVFNRYFLASYESAYYIGLKDLSWQIYKRTDKLASNYPVRENYVESLTRYIETEIHPEDREQAYMMIRPEEIKTLLKARPGVSFNFRNIHGRKQRILRCEIIRGADEDHIALGFRDVTDEEKAREEYRVAENLAEQQRHLRAFGDMVNAASWTMELDDNNTITAVRWSPEMRRMFGFSDEKEFPDTIRAWIDRLHPEDKESAVGGFYNGIAHASPESFVYDIRYRLLKKDGEYRWYHDIGRMEYADNGKSSMYGLITDITAEIMLEE